MLKTVGFESENLALTVNELGARVVSFALIDSKGVHVPIWRAGRAGYPSETYLPCASWLMAPWVGRLRHPWNGPSVLSDGVKPFTSYVPRSHAKDGPVSDVPFRLKLERDTLTARFSTAMVDADFFKDAPWPFKLDVEWSLKGPTMICNTTIANIGETPISVSFGHHPVWVRSPRGIAEEQPVITFSADATYEPNSDMLCPMGKPQPVPPEYDFSDGRPLPRNLERSFLGVQQKLRIEYPLSKIVAEVEMGGMHHLIIHSPDQGIYGDHFALAPCSAAPNAHNLGQLGVEPNVSGIETLEPTTGIQRWWALTVMESTPE